MDQVEEIIVEGGEAPVEESSGFVLVDSSPYTPTTPTFFPARSQDTGPTSPQYLGLTSPEYFPNSHAYSPTNLSNLLAELFEIPDPLAGVEKVESPIDFVELLVEPEEVIVPRRRRWARRQRIRYPSVGL